MAPYTWLCSVPIGATPCPTESPGAASMPVKPSLSIKSGSQFSRDGPPDIYPLQATRKISGCHQPTTTKIAGGIQHDVRTTSKRLRARDKALRALLTDERVYTLSESTISSGSGGRPADLVIVRAPKSCV